MVLLTPPPPPTQTSVDIKTKQWLLSAGSWTHSLTEVYIFKGIKYLYLTPQDYTTVSSLNSVHCKHVEEEGESR